MHLRNSLVAICYISNFNLVIVQNPAGQSYLIDKAIKILLSNIYS